MGWVCVERWCEKVVCGVCGGARMGGENDGCFLVRVMVVCAVE